MLNPLYQRRKPFLLPPSTPSVNALIPTLKSINLCTISHLYRVNRDPLRLHANMQFEQQTLGFHTCRPRESRSVALPCGHAINAHNKPCTFTPLYRSNRDPLRLHEAPHFHTSIPREMTPVALASGHVNTGYACMRADNVPNKPCTFTHLYRAHWDP